MHSHIPHHGTAIASSHPMVGRTMRLNFKNEYLSSLLSCHFRSRVSCCSLVRCTIISFLYSFAISVRASLKASRVPVAKISAADGLLSFDEKLVVAKR